MLRSKTTNLFLVGKAIEILLICVPLNEVCISGAQCGISFVVRNLPPLEPEAGVDPKCVIIEIPVIDVVSNKSAVGIYVAHSRSSPTERQLEGRLMDGIGHAGQTTASSPGDVPLIPVGSYDRPPRFTILTWRHSRSVRRNALYRSFKNIRIINRKRINAETHVYIGCASRVGKLFYGDVVVVERELRLKR